MTEGRKGAAGSGTRRSARRRICGGLLLGGGAAMAHNARGALLQHTDPPPRHLPFVCFLNSSFSFF